MTEHDHYKAGLKADELIQDELTRQDNMWGVANERADSAKGQLLGAASAQVSALLDRRNGVPDAFDTPPTDYPPDWSGFRDYGSDVANIAVAAAFLRQEMKRLIAAGADTTRKSRDYSKQPYNKDQPAVHT